MIDKAEMHHAVDRNVKEEKAATERQRPPATQQHEGRQQFQKQARAGNQCDDSAVGGGELGDR